MSKQRAHNRRDHFETKLDPLVLQTLALAPQHGWTVFERLPLKTERGAKKQIASENSLRATFAILPLIRVGFPWALLLLQPHDVKGRLIGSLNRYRRRDLISGNIATYLPLLYAALAAKMTEVTPWKTELTKNRRPMDSVHCCGSDRSVPRVVDAAFVCPIEGRTARAPNVNR